MFCHISKHVRCHQTQLFTKRKKNICFLPKKLLSENILAKIYEQCSTVSQKNALVRKGGKSSEAEVVKQGPAQCHTQCVKERDCVL